MLYSVHGKVAEEEFIEHHANLSFGTKGDADFRELVISCWGLDGGGGADGDKCMSADVADVLRKAHAPHRKFLVSYADGSQYVEDLPFLTAVSSIKLVSVSLRALPHCTVLYFEVFVQHTTQ